MKLRVSKTLKFWVDVACEQRRARTPLKSKQSLIAEVLREWEEAGEAMRYLRTDGKIAWKATSENAAKGWPMPSVTRKTSLTNGRDASGDFGQDCLQTAFFYKGICMQTLLPADNQRPKPEPIPYSTAALRQDLDRVRNAWAKCQRRRRRDAIYTYLSAVYELVTWWAAEGREVERARRALRSRLLDVPEREDPFAAIIRCTADPARVDIRTRSKWSQGYAVRDRDQGSGRAISAVRPAQRRHQQVRLSSHAAFSAADKSRRRQTLSADEGCLPDDQK